MVIAMNVTIVGNSNCVFRNGFAAGVGRYVKEVGGLLQNYSLGGSCCAMHIYTLHDKYATICASDVVIIDSLVIDTFHWKRGIIKEDELLSLIDDMYALYSILPANVVSVFFPIERQVGRQESLLTYKAHKQSARKYGVDVLDLYSLLPGKGEGSDGVFMQPSHIKVDVAGTIGYRLAAGCHELESERKETSEFYSPYEVVGKNVLNGLTEIVVQSSIYVAECYRLERGVSLSPVSGKSLIGAFHWNKTNTSKFVFSADDSRDVIQFRSGYAFFEVLNSRRWIAEGAVVRPGSAIESITQKPAGKNRDSAHGVPQLSGMLVRDDMPIDVPMPGENRDLSTFVGNVFG